MWKAILCFHLCCFSQSLRSLQANTHWLLGLKSGNCPFFGLWLKDSRLADKARFPVLAYLFCSLVLTMELCARASKILLPSLLYLPHWILLYCMNLIKLSLHSCPFYRNAHKFSNRHGMCFVIYFKKTQTNKLMVQQTERNFLYLTSLWKFISFPGLTTHLLLDGFQCFPSSWPTLHISLTILMVWRVHTGCCKHQYLPKIAGKQSQKHQIYIND